MEQLTYTLTYDEMKLLHSTGCVTKNIVRRGRDYELKFLLQPIEETVKVFVKKLPKQRVVG